MEGSIESKTKHESDLLLEQLGIFYTAQKLASLGWIVHSTAFSSPIDLIIEKKGILRKIQVKSVMKTYRKKYGTFWNFFGGSNGFYLRYHDIIDFLIFVCVDKQNNEYFVKKVAIFPKEDIPKSKGPRLSDTHYSFKTSHTPIYKHFENRWDLIK
jgi:hypothetical protein